MKGARLAAFSLWRSVRCARLAIAKLRDGSTPLEVGQDIAGGALATLVQIVDFAPTPTLRDRAQRELDTLADQLAAACNLARGRAIVHRQTQGAA
jgi:hypothetical protein